MIVFVYMYFLWLKLWEQARRDAWERLWERVAFTCRYGHQSVTDALKMPVAEMVAFNNALADLISGEVKLVTPQQ